MKFVFASYIYIDSFKTPDSWLQRIYASTGIMEALSAEHEVISIEQINYEGTVFHEGVQYHFKRFYDAKTRFPYRLNQYIRSLNPDVVFIQGLHHPLQVIQLQLMGKRLKIMAQHHAEQPFTGIKKLLQRLADRYIDAYLFASKELGATWVDRGNLGSLKKIHEVMEVSSRFSPMNKIEARRQTGATGNPVFLWVGRLNANKDPLNMVGAFLEFASNHPDARLYMIYHTEELLTEIKALLAEHGRQDNITLIGKVPHDHLLYWFNSADIILSGSHYEGSGTAICEAMSCGCVPLVTDIPAFRMITDNGRCGLLYEAGNRAALLTAFNKILETDLSEKRTRSLAYFKSNLSFEAIAGRIQQIAGSL